MKPRRGWHFASEGDLIRDHILDVAFRRDPDGLCHAVGKALNERLAGDPYMNGWQWNIDWHNLPGAIAIMVTGVACAAEEWQCPAFWTETSVATYEEVDQAAERLQGRIHTALDNWSRDHVRLPDKS